MLQRQNTIMILYECISAVDVGPFLSFPVLRYENSFPEYTEILGFSPCLKDTPSERNYIHPVFLS